MVPSEKRGFEDFQVKEKSLLSQDFHPESQVPKKSTWGCNRFCHLVQEVTRVRQPGSKHLLCDIVDSISSAFESVINQKNAKIRTLEKSLTYFESNFLKTKHKLNKLSNNLFKIKNYKSKERLVPQTQPDAGASSQYFIQLHSPNHKNKKAFNGNKKLDIVMKTKSSKEFQNEAKRKPKGKLYDTCYLVEPAHASSNDILGARDAKPRLNTKRRTKRSNIKSHGVENEVARASKKKSDGDNLFEKFNLSKQKHNFMKNGSKVTKTGSKGTVLRKKLFASKSHRIGSHSKNLDLYISDIHRKRKKAKNKSIANKKQARGSKENQKSHREKAKNEQFPKKKPKKKAVKVYDPKMPKAMTYKFNRIFSHRHSISSKIDHIQFVKNSKTGFSSNQSQVSPELQTLDLISKSMFRPKLQKSSLKSTPSNRHHNLAHVSHFNFEIMHPKSSNENGLNVRPKESKGRVSSKFKSAKKHAQRFNKYSNLEKHPGAKKLMIEINKNSNSLKKMSTTLNQIHLNYIFSQKKKGLANKFDIKYVYSNQGSGMLKTGAKGQDSVD